MNSYQTQYGLIEHVGEHSLYPGGTLKECMLEDLTQLNTEYGTLVPQYEYEEHRRKYIYSLSFYEDGSLRKIALNHRTRIESPLGPLDAELVTFYQSGMIKRLFPLNGRISAYWDETEEYKLATEDVITIQGDTIKAKIMAYNFYEDGSLKSLTLWPNERVMLTSPIGKLRVRIGATFYPNGSIKSVEPTFPAVVQTPIGKIKAFDLNANGISGDKNSLVFTEAGEVKELITSGMTITVWDRGGASQAVFTPEQVLDEDGLEISFHPLKLTFHHNMVTFNEMSSFQISDNIFIIDSYMKAAPDMCSNCSSCGACKVG